MLSVCGPVAIRTDAGFTLWPEASVKPILTRQRFLKSRSSLMSPSTVKARFVDDELTLPVQPRKVLLSFEVSMICEFKEIVWFEPTGQENTAGVE